MSDEFKVITTQEEFNSRIQERINRINDKYKDYVSPEDYQKEIDKFKNYVSPEDYQKEVDKYKDYVSHDEYQKLVDESASLKSKVAKYEIDSVKTKVATEMGLPLNLIDRIKGTTEEEIREDAKIFSDLAVKQPTAPLAGYDPVMTESQAKQAKLNNAYKQLLKE